MYLAAPKDVFLIIEGMAKAHITFSFNVINQLQISAKTVNTGQCKDVETRIESLVRPYWTTVYFPLLHYLFFRLVMPSLKDVLLMVL